MIERKDKKAEENAKHAVRNNKIILEQQAVVPVSLREVFFNFSVYESLKVRAHKALYVQDHLERLFYSAERLEIAHSFTLSEIEESITSLVSLDSLEKATIKIQLIGGKEPILFVTSQPLPEYPQEYYRDGIKVVAYDGERIIPEVKSNALLLNYVALREANKRGAFEALFVDRNGYAIEGTRSNVFAVRGNSLITSEKRVLAGVTRKKIIQAAEDIGLHLHFSDPSLQEMRTGGYDEVFISSTSMGALPVAYIDDSRVGKIFTITNRIHEQLKQMEDKELETCYQ